MKILFLNILSLLILIQCKGQSNQKDNILNSSDSISFNIEDIFTDTSYIDFKIDLTNSDFKFNKKTKSNDYYYTIDGNDINDSSQNIIIINAMFSITDSQLMSMASSIAEEIKYKYKLPNLVSTRIKINKERAYELSCEINKKGRVFSIYEVIYGNKNATLIFYGIAGENRYNTLKQFKKIARTLKIL